MFKKLQAILSKPFLLIQIGDYGHGYETMPIPPGLVPLALERQQRGEPTYPMNHALPPPYFHVPADVRGILMNKIDELQLNSFAYWAQTLSTRIHPRACINSHQKELLAFRESAETFWAVLVTKPVTSSPKGSSPGRIFERWTPKGYVREIPTSTINIDIVYTEAGKSTLVFNSLESLSTPEWINLNQYHVFFTNSIPCDAKYRGKRLPYRSSMYGTCSLMARGIPDNMTDIPLLKPESALCRVVAIASVHPHVCGRVLG